MHAQPSHPAREKGDAGMSKRYCNGEWCDCTCFDYKWLAAADDKGRFQKLPLCKAKAAMKATRGRTIYGVRLSDDGEVEMIVVVVPRVINPFIAPEGDVPREWRSELRRLKAEWLWSCHRARASAEASEDYY